MVHAVGQGGQDHGSYDFRACPGPEAFKRELVAVFARCASASGTWGSARTCLSYAKYLRQFLVFAAACHSPVTTVAQLTPAVWNTWTLPKPRRRQLRVLLLETVTLPADTRARMLAQRARATSRTPQTSYSWREFAVIRAAAGKTVRSAVGRIEANTGLLRRWRTGDTPRDSLDWWWGWLLDHVSRTGELPRNTVSTTGHRYFSTPVTGSCWARAVGRARWPGSTRLTRRWARRRCC